VRTFIVPATPQPDVFVAANYERFDGLEPLVNDNGGVPFGTDYLPSPRPGLMNTPHAHQTYTRSPNGGVVGTLGGAPLPDRHWNYRPAGDYTRAGTRTVGGPKRSSQWYRGQAETVFFAELQANPPEPGSLAMIISGLA
jgi:hypothetical protein